jgi:hypothetical protein
MNVKTIIILHKDTVVEWHEDKESRLMRRVVSAALAALINYFCHFFPSLQVVWLAVNFMFSFCVITLCDDLQTPSRRQNRLE